MRSVNSFVRFSDGPKLDTPHHDNIIYLPGQPEGDCHSVLSLAGKGVAHMYVTWSDLIVRGKVILQPQGKEFFT